MKKQSAIVFVSVFLASSWLWTQEPPSQPSASEAQNKATAGWSASNPFAQPSSLPFQAPAFDKIKDSDYQPALEEGMRQDLAENQAIANNPGPPTFANTIEAMQRSGQLLQRVASVFFGLAGANKNPVIQKVEIEEAPKLAEHRDAIYLNPKLFARVKAVYEQREQLGLAPEAKYLVERYYRDFVRAGALLSEADKDKVRALNKEESQLTTDYENRVLGDTNASAVLVKDRSQLAGLPAPDMAAAAEAAKAAGHPGQWLLTLQNTTQQPALAYLENRGLRERLFQASSARGHHGGPNDTTRIDERLAQLRAQRSQLLGYPNYAAYVLDVQMAKTPAHALKLMTDLVPAATAKVNEEARRIQEQIDKQKGGFKLEPWDWQYYSEQVRKAEYDLDESQVRPYFELDRVLRDGVFFAAHQLYGLTFKERKDIPVYQPDVRVFEVSDANGSPLALFYLDCFARPNKSGGAWTNSFADYSALMGTKPVVYNVENFTKPAPGQPDLLDFDEVTTMFHEFGHALQAMMRNVQYPGSAMPTDFVEVPSQFNEHWALYPAVLANYAKHYRTGEPMPPALVEKIKRSRTFNEGFKTTEFLESALLDMAWHTLPTSDPLQNLDTFEPQALKSFHIYVHDVPPRYHTAYFSHIWDIGYAANYYAYLWSEVIDDDAFAWFKEHGGLTRENGQRFREMILAPAGSEDAAAMYRTFRGRDAEVGPLLEERGLRPAKQ